jgi:DNA-directed RNA polymerase specialized sigma24 family protein
VDPIAPEAGTELHRRLAAGDATAPAEIAELFLPELVRDLRGRYRNLHDPDVVDLAVEDAVLSYLRRPGQFDPARSTLWRYLRMSARGDLLNLLAQSKAILATQSGPEVIELDSADTEYEIEDGSLAVEDQVSMNLSPIWQTLEELFDDLPDREVALLLMERVRSMAQYARALGAEAMPREEQERVVKRAKDRVRKTLQRHLDRARLEEV